MGEMLTNDDPKRLSRWLPYILLLIILTTTFIGVSSSKETRDTDRVALRPIDKGPIDHFDKDKNPLSIHNDGFFIENKGQWDSDIKFVTDYEGYRIIFTEKNITFIKRSNSGDSERISLEFIDSEKNKMIGEHILNDTINIFLRNDPTKWISSIHKYSSIGYRNLWNFYEIDIYFNALGLNYVFKNCSNNLRCSYIIKIHQNISVNTDNTEISGFIQSLIEGRPYYIPSQHFSNENFQNKFNSLSTKNIFDPLIFSSYLGGSDYDNIVDMKPDGYGNLFVAGTTWSLDLYNEIPGYNNSNNGYYDMYISNINLSTKELRATTYIGGSGFDGGSYYYGDNVALAIDSKGSIYLSGCTNSTDFPITSEAYDSEMNGSWDIAIIKMNNNLTELLFSTYIGGSFSDFISDIEISYSDIFYAVGYTNSPDFPIIENAYDITYNGNTDIVVFSLKDNGNSILFSTFLGGTKGEGRGKLIFNDVGEILIGGSTVSDDFPIIQEAYCSKLKGGDDLFISKFDSNLTHIISSTFIGGGYEDYMNDICSDIHGDILATGYTMSFDFPTTPEAFMIKREPGDYSDSFLFKMDSSLTKLKSSSYIGAMTTERYDTSNGLVTDLNGNIYLTGHADSPIFPVSYGSFDTMISYGDAFICKFNLNITELLYSSFFGGNGFDFSQRILLDNDDNVIIAGYNYYGDLPVTSNALQKNFKGGVDGFIAILNLSLPPTPPLSLDHELGNGFVQLSWEPPLKDGGLPVRGYKIYKTEPDLPEYICKEVGSDILSFNDTEMINGRTYRYRVTAFNDLGESLPSPQITVEDTVPPTISFIGPDDDPTTGDRFVVRCRVKDNVLIDGVFIEYRFDLEPRKNWSMEYQGNDIYSYSLDIPTNATGVLNLKVSALDPSWNWKRSEERTFDIMDNDLPVLISDRTVKHATTGSDFTFTVSVNDNIGIDKVMLEYRYNDETPKSARMNSLEDAYSYNINVKDVVGSIHYSYHLIDTSGNWLNTTASSILLQDGIPPVIKKDLSQDQASTGDEFVFKAEVYDTYGIYSITVEHWIGNSPHQFLDMIGDGTYSVSTALPNNQIGTMRYIIRASDEAGNTAETATVSVVITDNDKPTLKEYLGANNTFTGDDYSIKASFSDNIGLEQVYVMYRFGSGNEAEGQMVELSNNYLFTVNVPVYSVDPLIFSFIITDKAGNELRTGPFTIPVRDSILPKIEVSSPVTARTGEEITVNYSASDNIGVTNITWDGPYAVIEPGAIRCYFKKAGEYQYNLTATDAAGNIGSAKVLLIIEAQDHENGRSIDPLMIGILSLITFISIAVMVTFFYLKRKNRQESSTELVRSEQGE